MKQVTRNRNLSTVIKSAGETRRRTSVHHCSHLILRRPGLQSLLLHWEPTASQAHGGLALRADGRRAAMPKFMQSDS